MKSLAAAKTLVAVIALVVFALHSAQAQFLDSSAGLGAGFVKLFGDVKAFSAKADVRVYTNRVETLQAPMAFSLLDGKMRMDFDLNTMKGKEVQPSIVKVMNQVGLNQVSSVVRLDKRVIHVLFHRAQGYMDLPISKSEAEAAEKNVQVQRTPQGKETIANHPCTRHRVAVRNAAGAALLEAVTWNADDMKGFPLQIAVQTRDGTTLIRFSDVQMKRPAASQFDPPAKFTRHRDMDALLIDATQKHFSPITRTVPASTPAANKSKPVASRNAVAPKPATSTSKSTSTSAPKTSTRPTTTTPKTNTAPARPMPATKK